MIVINNQNIGLQLSQKIDPSLQCPIPHQQYAQVVMAHGGGGMLTRQLLDGIIWPAFDNEFLKQRHDSAVLPGSSRCAFTTDSYVINPLIFPGGDIGKLAVCGTLNDLAMAGARPMYLSVALIMEEGLPITTLQRVITSMASVASMAGVSLVTGDTKVVDKGKGDGLYINTSGIGFLEPNRAIHASRIKTGDVIIINGDIGRHGVAIMAYRENLDFETTIESDCADLSGLVSSLLQAGIDIHCMRDLTRGGLGAALIELAEESHTTIVLDERSVAVSEAVMGACEMLGLDPFYVANEGRFVIYVPEDAVESCLQLMRQHPLGQGASIIGRVTHDTASQVILETCLGSRRRLHLPSGEQLPRIC